MAAAKTTRQNLEKALAEREASMDGPHEDGVNGQSLTIS
jgi:hypothetical protein